jgi:molybdopterin-guanine dinucleotide biosynthesis protein A
MDITCAILSGGRSRRMGRDKASMPVAGVPLIERIFTTARTIFDDVMIVSNNAVWLEGKEAPTVKDALPVSGSLTGIVSALLAAETPYVFVLGCDMPFLRPEAIRFMMEKVQGQDIVIPQTGVWLEPLHAIYNRTCISPMLSAIQRNEMKIRGILPYVSVETIEPNDLFFTDGISVFTNINTEEDLKRAEKLLG